MRRTSTVIVLMMLILTALPAALASGEQGAPAKKARRFLNTSILAPPSPVVGTDKRQHLVYEILVDNPMRARVRLNRLVVRDIARHSDVAEWGGRAIKALMFGVDAMGRRRPGRLSRTKPECCCSMSDYEEAMRYPSA